MLKKVSVCKIISVFCAFIMTGKVLAAADKWQLNMYKGVTPISHDMYDLHMLAIGVCAVIGVVVFGVLIYSLIHHRKSKGYTPASFHTNDRLELIWTIIPFIILIGLAVPATTVLIRQDDSSESDITIKVVGSQWKWQYQYLDQGISFFSSLSTPYNQIQNEKPKNQWYLLEVDKPLVLPINKKIRFIVTSNDVIHSWWVPELGVKRDAIPGFMHEAWALIEKPGVYRGQCTELCGIGHGFMPIVVNAVSEEQFNQWVSQQVKIEDKYAVTKDEPSLQKTLTRAELMTEGKEKYNIICSACHQPTGKGIPPLYPALQNSSVCIGKPISRHISLVLNGVPGSAMQPYKDQLSDEEIAAIITYERNAWGNNTDDVIQPADVAKVRQNEIHKPTMVDKVNSGGFK